MGRRAGLDDPFWWGLAAAALLVGWQFVLGRRRDRDGCFRAFVHNHWVGLVVLAGIALAYGW